MHFLVRDRGFYRQLMVIAIPIAVQNLINFGVTMADTVMIGMIGEIELSAAAIANQLTFVLTVLCFGVGSGSNVMISQYWGKGEIDRIHRTMTVMYRILLCGVFFFCAVALFFGRFWMSIFSTDPAVIETGVAFLRIVGFSYLLSGITTSTVIVLRAVGSVNISLAVYLSSLVTNVTLNYALIFGKFGLPALGVQGAAIATCIARVVEFVVLIVYLVFFEKNIRYNIKNVFMRKLNFVRTYLKTALPVIFNEMLWGGGAAMVAVVIGRMGTQFTAANSVCTVISQLVTVMIYGVGNAAAVIVGNTVGSGRYDTAKQYARTFFALAIALGLVSCCVVLLLKQPMLRLYNISDTAKDYANQIMTIYAGIVVFQSLAMNLLVGVLRGGGDTRFVFVIDTAFLWLISIPLGFLTGLVLGWPVWAVYLVLRSDEIFKVLVAIGRIFRGSWINDITKI